MKTKRIALLLCLFLLLTACGTDSPQSSKAAPGPEIMANFVTKDLDGNILDQEILTGKKLTMVNVWATFCGPCLREMPSLEALSKEMAEQDVQIIGIVADLTDANYQVKSEVLKEAQEIAKEIGVHYTSLIPCRDLAALSSTQVFPTTFFVDEQGQQVGDPYVGARDLKTWRAIVEELLETMA